MGENDALCIFGGDGGVRSTGGDMHSLFVEMSIPECGVGVTKGVECDNDEFLMLMLMQMLLLLLFSLFALLSFARDKSLALVPKI